MSDRKHPRIFVGWDSGAFVNSDGTDFGDMLLELIEQFGNPSVVELRETYEGKPLCDTCLESDGDELCPDCASG